MSRIVLLGASSQLARDFALEAQGHHELFLYARTPDIAEAWFRKHGVTHTIQTFDRYGAVPHDVVINFIGAGDPARVAAMGDDIIQITKRFDTLALDYVKAHSECRYLFISSGAVDHDQLSAYACAKRQTESRHRTLSEQAIVDLRVFGYVSPRLDLTGRFFLCDVMRSLRQGTVLETSPTPMMRDYLHPGDFFQLVQSLLSAPAMNAGMDAYSLAPVEKFALLEALQQRFNLRYTLQDPLTPSPSGLKPDYYPTDRKAEAYGYRPRYTSLDGVMDACAVMLETSA